MSRHRPLQDNFPIRYSLRPEQRRAIAAQVSGQGSIKENSINALARHNYVAKKVIVDMMNNLGIEIVLAPKKTTKESAIQAAEHIFKTKAVEIDPVKKIPELVSVAQDAESVEDAMEMLLELETKLRDDQDVLLEALADFEEKLKHKTAEAEEARQAAIDATERTKQFRLSTRPDREELERVACELQVLKGNYNRLKGTNRRISGQLTASVKREKRLVNALNQSEKDCREYARELKECQNARSLV